MTGTLLVIAFTCFGLGVATDTIIGVQRRSVRPVPYLLGMAGSALMLVVGIRALTSASVTFDLSKLVNLETTGLLLDHLAGLFLTVLFALGIVVSAVFVSWVMPEDRSHRRGIASGYLLLLASVAGIILAADAFTFMFAWEALTVSFYMLTSVSRDTARNTGAPWSTVGIGKVSGAALLVGFLLMAGRSGSLTIASWASIKSGTVQDVAWVLVIVGFGAKLGLVPLQVWIPVGYPAAPGPARAAMAGIAANVGVYGLWRFLGTLGRPPIWLVIAVLVVGGITALIGITFAGVQARLGRVIAYSSIENAGLIVTGYGVALAGSFVGSELLMAIGLLAATLQAVTHAIAKTALFSSLAGIEAAVGTDDLESLRGVGRRMPWSGGTFAIGALTLTGLPPDHRLRVGVVRPRSPHAAVPAFGPRHPAGAGRCRRAGCADDRALSRGLHPSFGVDHPRPSDPPCSRIRPRAGHLRQGCHGPSFAILPRHCGIKPLGDPHNRQRVGSDYQPGCDSPGFEVAVDPPTRLPGILDRLAVMALARNAGGVRGGVRGCGRTIRGTLPEGAPGAGLALRDFRRLRRRRVHGLWLRKPAPARTWKRPRHYPIDPPNPRRGPRAG